ncbi:MULTISPECIES: hypothetical protein [unclassified Microbacterium]|uniref:hypothetical protein n=1 Tax=unclassified Microbacterium TaxID=2609290 RepID=UPI003017A0A6
MPVSRTRVCPSCNVEKNTPADFRDRGETGAGRPPKVCRRCRRKSPALREQQARNVERRELGRSYRHDLASRDVLQLIADQWAAHPHDIKTCPPVGGCGLTKPTADFHTNVHQMDALSPICAECCRKAAELRRTA